MQGFGHFVLINSTVDRMQFCRFEVEIRESLILLGISDFRRPESLAEDTTARATRAIPPTKLHTVGSAAPRTLWSSPGHQARESVFVSVGPEIEDVSQKAGPDGVNLGRKARCTPQIRAFGPPDPLKSADRNEYGI